MLGETREATHPSFQSRNQSQIVDLTKYSEFVNFVVQVRAIFFAEFQKHKELFPGIDGEATECQLG
jgi:hypothetical protein